MHSVFLQPLLALDLTHVAIMLILVFFGIMKQLFDANKKAEKKRQGPPGAPQQRQQRPEPGAQKPLQAGGGQADPLRSQVEEFLRRAGQLPPVDEPAQRQPPARLRPASEIEVLVRDDSRSPERRPNEGLSRSPSTRTSPAAAAAQAAEAADKRRATRRPKQRQSVAEHVAESVASRSKSLANKASQLGQRIVNDDEQFDVQLKAKFDHTVGSLASNFTTTTDQPAPPAVDTPARQIATLLANPAGVRQAVLLSEILRRPSERW